MNDKEKTNIKKIFIKIPPNSLIAEQSILGGLMLNNIYWDKILDVLKKSDFYSIPHQIIYQTMNELLNIGKPIDLITLSEQLSQKGKINFIGGITYLSQILENTPTTTNIMAYVDIVKKKSLLREIIFLADKIQESAFNLKEKTVEELIDFAESSYMKLYKKSIQYTKLPINIVDILKHFLKNNFQKKKYINGLDTGFNDLNKITLGFQNSDLIIIAGRPSMGKTTLAMNICQNIAMHQTKPVLIFSLEMSNEQIIKKILASLSGLKLKKIQLNNLNNIELEKFKNIYKKIAAKKNIFIDDSCNLNPTELRYKIKQIYKENNGLSLVMIDYLQLMKMPGEINNRNLEITEISRSLKTLAKEINIPIIAISQLNRYLELRHDKRPINSDLRESGSIEQDADLILFIYRDELYNINSKIKGIAEIIIGKNRNGPLGSIFLKFNEEYAHFENIQV